MTRTNWLGIITVVAILAASVLAVLDAPGEVIVAMIAIASGAASSIATRRTPIEPSPQPPPYRPGGNP